MIALDKLDQTNCQRRICPPFAKRLDWANLAAMNQAIDIDSIRDALRLAMAQKGVKPTTLSLKVGNNRTLVKDLLDKNSDVGVIKLAKLAAEMGIPLSKLISPTLPPELNEILAEASDNQLRLIADLAARIVADDQNLSPPLPISTLAISKKRATETNTERDQSSEDRKKA